MKEIPEKYRQDLAIVRETALQVIRDFEFLNIDIIFSGNERAAFDELMSQITPALIRLYKENPSHFQQLLYRIDIPEKQFRELLASENHVNFPKKIAEMLIRREFQKVLTRKYYSGKS